MVERASPINADFKSTLFGEAADTDVQADRFLEILDSLPNMVWLVLQDGRTQYYSRKWHEFTGVGIARDNALAHLSLVHPDDRERAAAAVAAAEVSGRYECEYRLRHHSGDYVWILSRGTPCRDAAGKIVAWSGTCTDIDELITARAGLSVAAGLNRSMVDSTPDTMLLLDLDGSLLSLNEAARQVMHPDLAASCIGRNWLETFPVDSQARIDAWLQALRGERANFTISYENSGGGGEKWWDVRLSPVRDASGTIVHVLLVGRDITHMRAMETRLQELQSELIHVSRVSAMGTMASTLAHELNQPLTAITSYIAGSRRLLNSQSADPAILQEALEQAERSTQRAGAIIRRLRNMVRGGPSHRKRVKVSTIIGEALELAALGSLSHEVAIGLDVDPGLEMEVDAVQLQQVMINLIKNAFEALEGCPRKQLTISALRLSDHVEIAVADTGPGLADEVKERLFDAFATSKQEGLGIGLSICRTIVEAHEGHISAAANAGGGATFTIRIPLIASDSAAAA